MATKIPVNPRKALSIFIDETGEFGFSRNSAKFYGISLVIHDQSKNINEQINSLNSRYALLGFSKMVHMGDLMGGCEDYAGMEIEERKKIFMLLYRFAMGVPASYHSFFFDKKYHNTTESLGGVIENKILDFIVGNFKYLLSFDDIIVYYDGGQKELSKVIDRTFGKLSGYTRKSKFDHTEKRLFQVADMLTYVDKLVYKYKKHIKFSNTEKKFFSLSDIKKIGRDLNRKRKLN